MVKFNFWEISGYFGKHPKKFKREARKQIEQNTLDYLRNFGRAKWVTVVDIFKDTLEQTDLFNSKEGKMWFAKQGIQSKINSATHSLRRKKHPIISGKGKKGYRYADENCEDYIDRWNEKVNAWLERKNNLTHEFETDKMLMEMIIERLKKAKRLKEAQQMKKVLIRYTKERKKVKDEENED